MPARQDTHALAEAEAENVPEAQEVQADMPAMAADPAAQIEHEVAAAGA